MNCSEFESLLYESIDASADRADAARMAAHEASCARCRRLAALVSGADASGSDEPVYGFAESVLEQTSGKPCGEVAVLLAEGGAEASQDALWPAHVRTCAECRALQGALARMLREAPALAEHEPDATFLDSVLGATPWRRHPAAARRARESLWLRFVRRPRAALEGAYVTAMLLLVVTGLPWSVSASPVRTLDTWWRERAEVANSLMEGAETRLRVGQAGLLDALDGSVQGTWRSVRAPDLENFGPRWNQTGSGSVEQDNTDRNRSGTD